MGELNVRHKDLNKVRVKIHRLKKTSPLLVGALDRVLGKTPIKELIPAKIEELPFGAVPLTEYHHNQFKNDAGQVHCEELADETEEHQATDESMETEVSNDNTSGLINYNPSLSSKLDDQEAIHNDSRYNDEQNLEENKKYTEINEEVNTQNEENSIKHISDTTKDKDADRSELRTSPRQNCGSRTNFIPFASGCTEENIEKNLANDNLNESEKPSLVTTVVKLLDLASDLTEENIEKNRANQNLNESQTPSITTTVVKLLDLASDLVNNVKDFNIFGAVENVVALKDVGLDLFPGTNSNTDAYSNDDVNLQNSNPPESNGDGFTGVFNSSMFVPKEDWKCEEVSSEDECFIDASQSDVENSFASQMELEHSYEMDDRNGARSMTNENYNDDRSTRSDKCSGALGGYDDYEEDTVQRTESNKNEGAFPKSHKQSGPSNVYKQEGTPKNSECEKECLDFLDQKCYENYQRPIRIDYILEENEKFVNVFESGSEEHSRLLRSLKEQEPQCQIKFETFRKKQLQFLQNIARCPSYSFFMKCKNCPLSKKCISFETIQETDKQVATFVLFEIHASTIPHPISERKVKEMKRIVIAKTACREGTSTAYLEQFENRIPTKILKLPNVQKIKERYKRKYIMDPDQKSDLQKTKDDLSNSDADSKVLKGFVRRFETEDDNNTIILQETESDTDFSVAYDLDLPGKTLRATTEMVVREKEKVLRREEEKIAIEIEGHSTEEAEVEISTITCAEDLANNPDIVFYGETSEKALNSRGEEQSFEETSNPVLISSNTERGVCNKNSSTLTKKQNNKAKGPLLRRLKFEVKKLTKTSKKSSVSDDMNAPSNTEKEMKPDQQFEEEKQSTEEENLSHHIGPYVPDDHDFKSLEPRSWINDNIVDAFICSRVSLFQENASSEQASMFHMDTKIVESLKKHGITDRILAYGLREKLLEKD
ncbi:uncharacterized protein LOC125178594, partial [Hyalella azteca]|uniref:Uncharacterized protein LOC125178594 n=1 Tax=Hyalella azteca TaxID=294128 RepID=A0A979FNR9_HYAAZ